MPLAIPIDNPFPVTLAISAIGLAAFGVELALATHRLRQHMRLATLLTGCLIGAAILALWATNYALNGPADAEPIVHLTGAPDPYYDFYRAMWIVNIVVAFLLVALVVVIGVSERRSSRALNPPQP
jgi:glycerol uptake facilitator-like aquaporin